ncbi:uncharacterized protein LOC132733283 isoform X2 [Ruditapes philippinarum]|uniref:uncharacterized protein LOC132733283 isoform X2 n=1 Tax=Ruditapes philippinarum TaxID=129788 RepID=UPI00295ABAA3|nr:uncharacterized protein LOC132733283 isoform X2 [Ruditapes philippinarum]
MDTKKLLFKTLCLILFLSDGLVATGPIKIDKPDKEKGEIGLKDENDIMRRLKLLETSQDDIKEENQKLKDENRKLREDLDNLRSDISSEKTRTDSYFTYLQSQINDQRDKNKHLEKNIYSTQTHSEGLQDRNKQHDRITQSFESVAEAGTIESTSNNHSNLQSKINPLSAPENSKDVKPNITETEHNQAFRRLQRSYKSLERNIGSGEHRIKRAQNEVNIAFYAVIGDHHVQHAGINQNIVFDKVITNLGNAYNKYSGDFKAPVSGTYVFSATLMAYDSQTAHYRIMSNGTDVGNMYLHGTGGATTAMTVILQLNKGDDVFLQNIDSDKPLHGYAYSTFSGYLLQQDFSATEIVGK